MQSLGRRGMVTAQRGKRGGFLLARPAEELSVLQVINTVEPIQRTKSARSG
jgi:DNA-binding IscR family transcriptional regulator